MSESSEGRRTFDGGHSASQIRHQITHTVTGTLAVLLLTSPL